MDTLPHDIIEYIHILKNKSYFDDVIIEMKRCVKHTLTTIDENYQSELFLKHLDTYIWYQFSNNFLQVFFTNSMYHFANDFDSHYCYENIFI